MKNQHENLIPVLLKSFFREIKPFPLIFIIAIISLFFIGGYNGYRSYTSEKNLQNAQELYGDYTLSVNYLNFDEVDKIKTLCADCETVTVYQKGINTSNGLMIYGTSSFFDISNLELLQGQLPKNKKEVLCEQKYLIQQGITFSESQDSYIELEGVNYLITGTMRVNDNIHIEGYYMPRFFLDYASNSFEKNSYNYSLYIVTPTQKGAYELKNHIVKERGIEESNITFNNSVLIYTGTTESGESSDIILSICDKLFYLIFVLLAIVFTSVVSMRYKKMKSTINIYNKLGISKQTLLSVASLFMFGFFFITLLFSVVIFILLVFLLNANYTIIVKPIIFMTLFATLNILLSIFSFSNMAEYYSVELAEKVTRGMMENALKCKYNGGTLPIGYKVDEEQNYEIDEVTAPAVVLAFKSYAEGMSMQHIANMLNYQGVRTHKKTKLDVDIVARMLHNRKYIGEYKFKDVITPGGIPAIVDKGLFELVQEKMKQNKKAPAKHKAEDEYLLTTKLYCGKCQCLMVGESGTSRTKFVHRYYKCVSVKNHKGCDKKTVKKAWIEDIVVDSIRRLIMNDETIEYLTDQALETFNKDSTVLPILQKQYAQTLTAINNLITAMEKGIITPTTKERMEELEAEKSELSIRIMKEEMSRPKLTREEILYWFYKFRKLNTKKLDHRRTLINNFVNSVFLFEDRMVITFNFKDGTETITFADLEKSALGSDFKVSGAPKKFRPTKRSELRL